MIKFYKYQGLGNDFILFDLSENPAMESLDPNQISSLCDRKLAIGADGILLYSVMESGKRLRMIYYNSDGSRAETCFNGLRSIALHGARSGDVSTGTEFEIVQDAGIVNANVNDGLNSVKIELAPARYEPEFTHLIDNRELIDDNLEFSFGTLRGTFLSMGNPHFVCWKSNEKLDDLNEVVLKTGSDVEKSSHFTQGTNFELASIINSREINMAVWERGAGYTLACGSGATAAVCAGVKIGSLSADQPVVVFMAGGKLVVNVHEDAENIEIEGEATFVYTGEIDIEEFRIKGENGS